MDMAFLKKMDGKKWFQKSQSLLKRLMQTRINFSSENTWKNYKEISVLPSILVYYDKYDGFYMLSLHFLSFKIAIEF